MAKTAIEIEYKEVTAKTVSSVARWCGGSITAMSDYQYNHTIRVHDKCIGFYNGDYILKIAGEYRKASPEYMEKLLSGT